MDILVCFLYSKESMSLSFFSQTMIITKSFSAPQQRPARVRGWLCDTGNTKVVDLHHLEAGTPRRWQHSDPPITKQESIQVPLASTYACMRTVCVCLCMCMCVRAHMCELLFLFDFPLQIQPPRWVICHALCWTYLGRECAD